MRTPNQLNVLFICNDNASRSVMAEVLLNSLGRPRFEAFSAGTNVQEGLEPDSRTMRALAEASLPTGGLRRKSWTAFSGPTAPHMDLVVTLCDEAAGEQLPQLPGQPATAHWAQRDPLHAGPGHTDAAFRAAIHEIRRHIELLVNLPPERVERLVLEAEARRLAEPTAVWWPFDPSRTRAPSSRAFAGVA